MFATPSSSASLFLAVAHMVGVSHLPELQSVPLVPDNKYLVICSDGISQVTSRIG